MPTSAPRTACSWVVCRLPSPPRNLQPRVAARSARTTRRLRGDFPTAALSPSYGFETGQDHPRTEPRSDIIRKMVDQVPGGAKASWHNRPMVGANRGALTVGGNHLDLRKPFEGSLLLHRVAGIREPTEANLDNPRQSGSPSSPPEKRGLDPGGEEGPHALSPAVAHHGAISSDGPTAVQSLRRKKLYSPTSQDHPSLRLLNRASDHRGCGKTTIVADPVEDLIAKAILVRLDSPELAEALTGHTQVDEDLSRCRRRAGGRQRPAARAVHASTATKQITAVGMDRGSDRIQARIDKAETPPPSSSDQIRPLPISQRTG